MTAKELINKCDGLAIFEQRKVAEDCAEVVFFSKDLEQWSKRLTDILGEAVKPAGTAPTRDDTELTKEIGGISDNQTLFKKEFGSLSMVVMFWPWQDSVHITMKVFVGEE